MYLLLDARRGFMDMDGKFVEFMITHKIPFQVVVTKVDRLASEKEVHEMIAAVAGAAKSFDAPNWLGPAYLVSSQANRGLIELRGSIEAALAPKS